MCVKLNSLFDSEMKFHYVKQVLKQCINIKTMCPNYLLEIRNTKSHLLQACLGASKMMSVKLLVIVTCTIVLKCYAMTYFLLLNAR